MRYPKFIQPGEKIGFVAPAFGCNMEPYHSAFLNAIKTFEEKGFGAHLGPNCFEGKGIGISNSPKACGDELNEWYASGENAALISCGGGETMCEVVPFIDFDNLKEAEPKWFMGYSDNTNFTFLSATLMDTAAIYGPCAAAFGMEPWHPAIEDAFELLQGKIDTVSGYGKWEKESLKDAEHPLAPYNVTEESHIIRVPDQDVTITGRLLGGCLDILQMYPGTPYDKVKVFNEKYKEDGIIWFLESCDLNIMSIRRALWQLKEAGWFTNVKAFLIGRPLCHGSEMFGCDQYQAVTDLLGEYDVPILMDLDIGHIAPMMPLICGATAEVEVKNEEISIHYTYK